MSLSTAGPLSNTWFLRPVRAHNPNVFAQMTAECPHTLQWAHLPPPQNCPSHGGSGPPSNTWFPGPTRVLNPNGIAICAAVFVGLTSVTDRQTDHATRSVTIGRIYVRNTAMRPNNTNNNSTTMFMALSSWPWSLPEFKKTRSQEFQKVINIWNIKFIHLWCCIKVKLRLGGKVNKVSVKFWHLDWLQKLMKIILCAFLLLQFW